ncbi:MAG: HDOD domain-containing protein [Kiritimatiellae bacterium]|nr:HDOD domain-containing protein [Kiritimatiellia bacterium]
MLSKKDIAQRVVEGIERLPPLPSNVVELRKAAADSNVSFSRLVPLLSKDPGLSADLLRFANSARYGVTHKVETLEEAVLYFGMNNLIEFVAASFTEGIIRKAFGALKNIDRYFEHSRDISKASRILAGLAGLNSHDQEAYSLAGLLHDIGKLVLALAANQEALPLIGAAGAAMHKAIEKEKDLWGLDHCEVGGRICRKWNFPRLFREAALRHHAPRHNGSLSREGAIVFLAHMITIEGLSAAAAVAALHEDALANLRLSPEKLGQAKDAYWGKG